MRLRTSDLLNREHKGEILRGAGTVMATAMPLWIANAARQLNPSLLSVKKDKAVSSGLLRALMSAVSLKNAPMQLDLSDSDE